MDILCVGHAAWDISAFVDEYPAEDSKSETRTLLECGGGPAANAAYLLSEWGAACALATTVGDDVYADRVLDEFCRCGTDISLSQRSPDDPTPVSMILVNQRTGSRTIVNRKADVASTPLRITQRPNWESPPRVLLFDGHELGASLDAMRLYPEATTILDAGSARPGTVELAKHVDYLVASDRFAKQLSDEPDLSTSERQADAVQALWEHNGRPVVITMGERGLLHGTPDSYRRLPAYRVASVDTTAAGDVFHGAFAYGVLKQLALNDTLRLASAAAALSSTVRGGRTSIPAISRVEQFLTDAKAVDSQA